MVIWSWQHGLYIFCNQSSFFFCSTSFKSNTHEMRAFSTIPISKGVKRERPQQSGNCKMCRVQCQIIILCHQLLWKARGSVESTTRKGFCLLTSHGITPCLIFYPSELEWKQSRHPPIRARKNKRRFSFSLFPQKNGRHRLRDFKMKCCEKSNS